MTYHDGSALPQGTRIDQYAITGLLGRGGFGITYLVRDELLNRDFALKEYFPDGLVQREGTSVRFAANPNSESDYRWGLRKFYDEARLLAQFNHPNIISVRRVFQANNSAYMVLDFVQGPTLENWLQGLDSPPTQEELDLISVPLLNALELVHANRTWHLDISPDNIMIRATDGVPILLDFGASRFELKHHSQLVSAMVFKSGYSAPEQYTSNAERYGPWTDIYAFAATLYRAIAGTRPTEATERQLEDLEEKPAVLVGKGRYREAFLKAIDWALKIPPRARPQSIAEWRKSLLEGDGAVVASAMTRIVTGRGQAALLDAAPGRQPAPGPSTGPAKGRLPLWMAVAGMVCALGIGAGVMHVWQVQSRNAQDARVVAEAQAKAERERLEAEAKRLADAAAAKKKADEEASAKARAASEAKRQQDERLAAEKKAADERARQQAEAKRKADLAEQQRREQEAKKAALVVAPPLDRVLTAAEEQQLAPKQEFQECKDCPRMIVVPAGSFLMGSAPTEITRSDNEGPQHTVTLAKPFAAGKFEVTLDQYKAFVEETRHIVPNTCNDFDPIRNTPVEMFGRSFRFPDFQQGGDHPAVCVSWRDAKAYVGWLSGRLSKQYRLLTESEWEYAARAGNQARYHFGEDEKRLCEFGNVADSADPSKLSVRPLVDCRDGYLRTAPVGKFAPNAFGLHDTIGNAWEWVEDCANPSYAGAPADGSAWLMGACTNRIARGGGWGSIAANHRSAVRNARFGPDDRYFFLGFRVARTLARGSAEIGPEASKRAAAEAEQRQRMPDTALVGDIIVTESGRRSSIECRDACRARGECKAYEYRLSGGVCYLYRRVDRQFPSTDAISGRWD